MSFKKWEKPRRGGPPAPSDSVTLSSRAISLGTDFSDRFPHRSWSLILYDPNRKLVALKPLGEKREPDAYIVYRRQIQCGSFIKTMRIKPGVYKAYWHGDLLIFPVQVR